MFEFSLEDELFALEEELLSHRYLPHAYESFFVYDPKRRHIHKASVRDRVVHQALYRILAPLFEPSFIFDSFSSQKGKGTHTGVKRLERGARKITRNWKKGAYMLKCDIQKFFDSIDQRLLFAFIKRKVSDQETLQLIAIILHSFEKSPGRGLPLGNVTSQLFANVYLNILDQYVKHSLKVKFYFRYCDDFVFFDEKKEVLEKVFSVLSEFLAKELILTIHPQKVVLQKINYGIDFLGYVVLPHYRVLRTKTKKRIIRKIHQKRKAVFRGALVEEMFQQALQSYLGMLKHCHGHKIERKLLEI